MHVFLTGDVHTGKSTALARYLDESGLTAGGFRTVADNYAQDGSSEIFLLGVHETKAACGAHNRVARRNRSCTAGYTAYPTIFDTVGCALLNAASRHAQIILMDALGFMESDALAFQRAVLRCLDGDIPVVGVVKRQQTPFLERVRSHPGVCILEVNQENRAALPARIREALQRTSKQ